MDTREQFNLKNSLVFPSFAVTFNINWRLQSCPHVLLIANRANWLLPCSHGAISSFSLLTIAPSLHLLPFLQTLQFHSSARTLPSKSSTSLWLWLAPPSCIQCCLFVWVWYASSLVLFAVRTASSFRLLRQVPRPLPWTQPIMNQA